MEADSRVTFSEEAQMRVVTGLTAAHNYMQLEFIHMVKKLCENDEQINKHDQLKCASRMGKILKR
jgi:hypothetical protein